MRSFTWKAGDVRVDFSVEETQKERLFDADGQIDINKVRELVNSKLACVANVPDTITIPYHVETSQPRESFKVSDQEEINLVRRQINVMRELLRDHPIQTYKSKLNKLKERFDELTKA